MPLAHLATRPSLLAVALAFAAGGCGDAPSSRERTGRAEDAVTFPNDKTACDYFVANGLTAFQAAGIVGNLDQESGVDPTAVQAGGPGRGIAQWSVGGRWDTDANDNAVAFASQRGQSVWSLQLQLDFIWYELTTVPGYGLAALRTATNVTDATVAFERDFEGCGQCDEAQRIAYAQAALPDCSAPPYAAQFLSQSFPLASATMTMVEGQVVPSTIELKNVGTKTWDANTRIGTTQPRDRKSAFADGTWIAGNRLAAVQGTVPPGGTYKFAFDLAAPMAAGSYDEFFGVVQDGTAWFGDPGQGGPPDDDLEVKITVVAPDYRAVFKDQSFPVAPAALAVHQGDVVAGTIELTNTGVATWKAGATKLAPIPRDKPSPFADPSWLSPARIATIAADVAPGAVGRFDVALDATTVGEAEIALGVVEEGVTWFADAPRGGGPTDGALKVRLVVAPPGAPLPEGGVITEADGGVEAGAPLASAAAADPSGCSAAPGRAPGWGAAALLLACLLVRAARRRVSRARVRECCSCSRSRRWAPRTR
jgi:hypothetical protein